MSGINRLSDTTIRKAKPSDKVRKLCDGDKLYLYVMPSGKKIWRILWRKEGRDKQFTIGEYPAVSLANARSELMRVKGLLAQHLDSNDERKWNHGLCRKLPLKLVYSIEHARDSVESISSFTFVLENSC